jgi:hypothetical protein
VLFAEPAGAAILPALEQWTPHFQSLYTYAIMNCLDQKLHLHNISKFSSQHAHYEEQLL